MVTRRGVVNAGRWLRGAATAAAAAAAALACQLLACLPLAGCGGGLSGTWADEAGLGSFEFQRDGTVYVTSFGGTIGCSYEVDGDHVIVKGPNGTQVLTRRGDRLEAGLGLAFVRR